MSSKLHGRISRVLLKAPTLTAHRIAELKEKVNRVPVWKERKDIWAGHLWEAFCTATHIQQYPLEVESLTIFFSWLVLDCEYMLTSLKQGIYPALIRLHIASGSPPLTELQKQQIRQHFDKLSKMDDVKKEGKGMEPLIIGDLERVLLTVPPLDDSRALDSSLFLFALSTGARAISCHSIRLCDFIKISDSKETGLTVVTINIPVGKADPSWNHQVSIEGDLEEEGLMDAVYWINQYLIKEHHVDIKTLVARNHSGEESQTPLWSLTEDSMRTHVKARVRQAGYPAKKFGFHSFRSGMLCSALISADQTQDARKAVFEETAIIAGWTLNGKAQMRYIKEPMRRGMIATRVVGLNTKKNSILGGVIRSDIGQPEVFHDFEIKPPKIAAAHYLNVFRRYLMKNIPMPSDDKRYQDHFTKSCVQSCYYYFGSLVTTKTSVIIPKDCEVPKSYYLAKTLNNGSKFISEMLHDNPNFLDELLENALLWLHAPGRIDGFAASAEHHLRKLIAKESTKDKQLETMSTKETDSETEIENQTRKTLAKAKGEDDDSYEDEETEEEENEKEKGKDSEKDKRKESETASGCSTETVTGERSLFEVAATIKVAAVNDASSEAKPRARRVRREWTKDEDQLLLQHVANHETFTAMVSHFPHRDRKALADHYNILQRKAKDQGITLPEPTYAHQKVSSPPHILPVSILERKKALAEKTPRKKEQLLSDVATEVDEIQTSTVEKDTLYTNLDYEKLLSGNRTEAAPGLDSADAVKDRLTPRALSMTDKSDHMMSPDELIESTLESASKSGQTVTIDKPAFRRFEETWNKKHGLTTKPSRFPKRKRKPIILDDFTESEPSSSPAIGLDSEFGESDVENWTVPGSDSDL